MRGAVALVAAAFLFAAACRDYRSGSPVRGATSGGSAGTSTVAGGQAGDSGAGSGAAGDDAGGSGEASAGSDNQGGAPSDAGAGGSPEAGSAGEAAGDGSGGVAGEGNGGASGDSGGGQEAGGAGASGDTGGAGKSGAGGSAGSGGDGGAKRQCDRDGNACENGGTCVDQDGGGYFCDCGPGLSGQYCETTPVAVAASGGGFTCLLRSDASLFCWGRGDEGQTQPPDGEFQSLSVGPYAHGCALRMDETLACWGRNNYSQSTPPPGTFKAVAAGGLFSCGIESDDGLVCWGLIAEPPVGSFTAVAAGAGHACALTMNGTIICWGDSANQKTDAPFGSYYSISAGNDHTCAHRYDAAGVCWGMVTEIPGYYEWIEARPADACGETLEGEYVCSRGSQPFPPPGFSNVEKGMSGLCGEREQGYIECFYQPGELGQWSVPSQVHAASVGVGAEHSCAVRHDGSAFCWGDNSHGQSDPPSGAFILLSAGDHTTCGIRTDQSLVCWGGNETGLLDEPSGEFVALHVAGYSACAIRAENAGRGGIECWGNLSSFCSPLPGSRDFWTLNAGCGLRWNSEVQCWRCTSLGLGYPMQPLAGPFEDVVAAAFGGCGRRSTSGLVECWDHGPAFTPPATTFESLAASSTHFCGISTNAGRIECWGPDSAYYDSFAPPGDYAALSLGDFHGCALRADRTLLCWGKDGSAQVSIPATR